MRKRRENCREENRIFIGKVLILIIIMGCIVKYAVDRSNENAYYKETNYNMAFGQLVYYVESLENWLAKATISTSGKNSIETLTEISRQSDLAVTYLSQVPLSTRELTKTAKFLNQLSEYSHSLSRKAISNEELSQEDLENIEMLHNYSVDLKNGLSQMYADIENGIISWNDITNASVDNEYVQEVDNISLSTLVDIDNTFSSYAGLIYDGAFSEHIEKEDKKALEGKDVSENEAKEIVKKVFSDKNVKNINSNGELKEANIPVYHFTLEIENSDTKAYISISKKGGKVIMMTYPKQISATKISKEQADKIGKEYLAKIGFDNMKETYYQVDNNTITVNYAYNQDGIIIYPDLIKLKISLLDGEILGIETTGYINCHTKRNIEEAKISVEEAKKSLNKKLKIESENLAIIPTEWKTEILCYEFKGKVNETEFLVYINAKTGEEEQILVIIETEGGILTM